MFTYHARVNAISYEAGDETEVRPDEVVAWAAVQQVDIFAAILERLDGIMSKLDQIDNTIAGK